MKKLSSKVNPVIFNTTSYLAYGMSTLSLIVLSNFYPQVEYYPVLFNPRFLAFTLAITSTIYYCKKNTNINFLKYFALILGLWIFSLETTYTLDINYNITNPVILSISWILYSAAITTTGILRNLKEFKITGIWILIIAIIKILIFDLSGIEALYRTIAFFILGIILMLVSYFYAKYSKKQY